MQQSSTSSVPLGPISFTSVSSLTPPPPSSRKIKSSGEMVVENTDSEDGDSDSSLEDIDEMMATRRAASALASFQKPSSAQTPDKSTSPLPTRSQNAAHRKNIQTISKPESQRIYKFSLSSLVNQFDKDTATKQRIEKANSALEAEDLEARKDAQAREKAKTATEPEDGTIDEAYFASVVDDNEAEEHPQRVIAAMRRTEALQQDLTWHFFNDNPESIAKRDPFPLEALPEIGWMTALKGPWERQQACLTGFVSDMTRIQELPFEIISWMLDETIFEPRDDLAYAYMNILERCPQSLKQSVTIHRLDAILNKLGGKKRAVMVEEIIAPTFTTLESKPPPHLRRLFQAHG